MREEASKWTRWICPFRMEDETFSWREEDWSEEGLLVSVKKNKRGRIIGEGSSTPKKEVHNKIMCHYLEEFRCRQVTTMVYQCKHGEWCSHAPTKFCSAQRSLCGAICTSSSTTTKCGHQWRIHWNMQIIAAIQTNANQMGEGNANIAYELTFA
jgi:hypothetical protein